MELCNCSIVQGKINKCSIVASTSTPNKTASVLSSTSQLMASKKARRNWQRRRSTFFRSVLMRFKEWKCDRTTRRHANVFAACNASLATAPGIVENGPSVWVESCVNPTTFKQRVQTISILFYVGLCELATVTRNCNLELVFKPW